ncbi:hypothetical protein Ga0076813_11661 [endosymbiont of Ridgeia piscesae]|jgi:hypothetical protein|uniref:Uncharacterized protein n=2 Tax=sulfur-oxidizing symbionts TaxID=32036 RepID=G2D9G4_9GAMM|nr:hypothetical protein Rifp1Sym_ac00350 [endosymbiont of Riftia pachyptila (vent Ph05)]KRT57500.1 hypothetical protein Ga0076813_11661 [endosymbiont of Ridgeia piscesae]
MQRDSTISRKPDFLITLVAVVLIGVLVTISFQF